ncbi:hypothetical protein [Azonexus sp.]|uniref:hypothetical protein n=1 Tax=Azonexus sp. TaxID=1872668 RepID=UPI0027B9DCFD|nr:hypothetical protein [Azonexus sp.]
MDFLSRIFDAIYGFFYGRANEGKQTIVIQNTTNILPLAASTPDFPKGFVPDLQSAAPEPRESPSIIFPNQILVVPYDCLLLNERSFITSLIKRPICGFLLDALNPQPLCWGQESTAKYKLIYNLRQAPEPMLRLSRISMDSEWFHLLLPESGEVAEAAEKTIAASASQLGIPVKARLNIFDDFNLLPVHEFQFKPYPVTSFGVGYEFYLRNPDYIALLSAIWPRIVEDARYPIYSAYNNSRGTDAEDLERGVARDLIQVFTTSKRSWEKEDKFLLKEPSMAALKYLARSKFYCREFHEASSVSNHEEAFSLEALDYLTELNLLSKEHLNERALYWMSEAIRLALPSQFLEGESATEMPR